MFIMGLSLFQLSFIQNQSVNEILNKVEKKYAAGSVVGKLNISVTGQKWVKEMNLQTWSLGSDFAMVKMLDDKNEGMVFLKEGKNVWNYIPKLNKIVKMPAHLLSSGFMGSDISADNLLNISSFKNDYDVKKIGMELVNKRNCHHLILTPKENAKVLWGKIEMFIDEKEHIQMKMVFFDDKLKPSTEMVGDNIKNLGGRLLASTYKVKSFTGKKQETDIEYKSLDFSQKLTADFFTKENMKKI